MIHESAPRVRIPVAGLLIWSSLSLVASGQGLLAAFYGDSQGEQLGHAVGLAGDLDGDGIPDVIAGSHLDDNNGTDSGSARVVSSKTGAILFTADGGSPGDQLGSSVGGVGDVDGDGVPDLITGAPFDDNSSFVDAGSAIVYSGATGSTLSLITGSNTDARLGWSVAGGRDVNNDGQPDFVVGAPRDSTTFIREGAAFVYSGSGSLIYGFHGDSTWDHIGWSVNMAGDVDGDGFEDVVVGAPFEVLGSSTGTVRVYSGKTGSTIHTFVGIANHADSYGWAVAGAGDVDGDGAADLIVGMPNLDGPGALFDVGGVQVLSGQSGALLYQVAGGQFGVLFGSSVTGVGDVTGDGLDDVAAGEPVATVDGVLYGGAIRVLDGMTGVDLWKVGGKGGSDTLGWSAAGLGDVNGDGRGDLAVGVSGSDVAAKDAGGVYILSGTCGSISTYGAGCAGTGGYVPTLSLSGCPTPDGSITLEIELGLAGSTALLLASYGQGSAPLPGGCTLLLQSPLVGPWFLPLASSPWGGAIEVQSGPLPPQPQGVPVFLQAFIPDPGAANGQFSSTNGVTFSIE